MPRLSLKSYWIIKVHKSCECAAESLTSILQRPCWWIPPVSLRGCSLTPTPGPQKYCCVAKAGKQTAVFPGRLKQEGDLRCISIESPSHMGTVCVEDSFDVVILGATIGLTSHFCRWISGCESSKQNVFLFQIVICLLRHCVLAVARTPAGKKRVFNPDRVLLVK